MPSFVMTLCRAESVPRIIGNKVEKIEVQATPEIKAALGKENHFGKAFDSISRH